MQLIAGKKMTTRDPETKVISLVLLCLDHLYNRTAFFPVTMLQLLLTSRKYFHCLLPGKYFPRSTAYNATRHSTVPDEM